MEKEDSFPQRVWQIVAAIPEGYVTTYGDVAKLAGSPRAARQVGGVLKRLPEGSTLPWHRVVNRHGTISLTGPDLQRQRQALLAEGVMVSGSGQIDLQRYRWRTCCRQCLKINSSAIVRWKSVRWSFITH